MISVTKVENVLVVQVKISGAARAVKNGFTRESNQRDLCHDCDKSRVLHQRFSHSFNLEAVSRSFLERVSLCSVSRVFIISYYPVYKELNLCFY